MPLPAYGGGRPPPPTQGWVVRRENQTFYRVPGIHAYVTEPPTSRSGPEGSMVPRADCGGVPSQKQNRYQAVADA